MLSRLSSPWAATPMGLNDGNSRYSWRCMALLIAAFVPTQGRADPLAYVTNYNSSTVSIIDTARNAVVGTLAVGSHPVGVAVDPAGRFVYVSHQNTSGSISVIRTTDHNVVATVRVGYWPTGVAVHPAGTAIYVANKLSHTLSIIETKAYTVIATVPVGGLPTGVAVHPAGTAVYITSQLSNTLSIVETKTNTVVGTVPVGRQPDGVAVHPSGSFVFVANRSSHTLTIIETKTNTVIASVPVGNSPVGVSVDPSGTFVFVSNMNSNTVSVIQTSNHALVATVAVGTGPLGLTVHPAGTLAYVANAGSHTVSVISATRHAVVTTVPVGSTPVAFGSFIPAHAATTTDQITLEGEQGTGDGVVMSRSGASGNQTIWLRAGQSRTLSFQLASHGRYAFSIRYSNDNFGPLETVTVGLDSVEMAQFMAKDSGNWGLGWNEFISTGPLFSVDLQPGAHQVRVSVSGGDGYGVEIDLARLNRSQ